jgi:hypothetical protein
MANAVITVFESDGTTETDVTVLDVGRQAVAASKSVGLATEDKAVLDAIAASLALIDNVTIKDSAANGTDQGFVVHIHPDSVNANGQTTASASAPVVPASDWVGAMGGNVAHDAADSGNPLKVGAVAIAHGTNPTAVTAADRTNLYANRAGIPFVIGGHPNVITRSATIDDGDGAQTNASLLTVSAGSKIVITSISATCSSSNSGSVAVRIGFGAATLTAASEAGAAGILLEGKFAAGGGHQRGNGSGILGIGADDEDLRITCDDPAGGSLFVTFSYYTVES